MKHSLRLALGAGATALATFALAPAAGAHTSATAGATAGATGGTSGAVYAQTNDSHSNHLLVFSRAANGTLHAAGSLATGGRGGAASGAAVDPLASQGSVTYDASHHLVLVTN